jgi:hypothetical protein
LVNNSDSNSFLAAVRENLIFDLTVHRRIPRLQRSNASDGRRAAQLPEIEVENSYPTNLALALQGGRSVGPPLL